MTDKPFGEVDNPEWTAADFAGARPGAAVLPAAFLSAYRQTRGPQAAPLKQQVTLRLSPDVVAAFRATGKGWQTRIDAALKAHLGL